MKLIVRLLAGEPFALEAPASETVSELKRQVAEVKSELVLEQMMLIHAGKILEDATSLQDAGLRDGDFVVACNRKPAAAKQEEKAEEKAAEEESAGKRGTPFPLVVPEAKPSAQDVEDYYEAMLGEGNPAEEQQFLASGEAAIDADQRLTPAEEDAVQRLVVLGFDWPTCLQAYLACGKNEELAASALLDEVYFQEEEDEAMPDLIPVAAPEVEQSPQQQAPERERPDGPSPLQKMRDDPNFAELAKVVAEKPEMLDGLIEALAQSDPATAKAIRENREEFLQMAKDSAPKPKLSPVELMLAAARGEAKAPAVKAPAAQPPAAKAAAALLPAKAAPQAQSTQQRREAAAPKRSPQEEPGRGREPAAPPAVPAPQRPSPEPRVAQAKAGAGPPQTDAAAVALSPEDEAVVSRLAATLGFEREVVRETYQACNRDEELTGSELIWMQEVRQQAQEAAEAQRELPEPKAVPWHAEERWALFANARHYGDDLEHSGQALSIEEALQWADETPNCVGFTVDRWCEPPTVWFHAALCEQDCAEGHEGFDLYVHRARYSALPAEERELERPMVELSHDDEVAVQRLTDLGVSTEAALEAYLAAGRNAEYASNLLFSDDYPEYVD